MAKLTTQNNSKSKKLSSLHSEENAQAEAVFRLMIDSIIGIAILLIIISVVGYFNGQVIDQSKADLIKWIRDGSNSPDGSILTSGDLTFAKGFGVDATSAQEWTGVSSECFTFDARTGAITLRPGSDGTIKGVEFAQNITTKVYVQCKKPSSVATCDPTTPPTSADLCCFKCVISFGKAI